MSTRLIAILLLALGLLVCPGCSSTKVTSATAPGVELTRFETFRQLPPPERTQALPGYTEAVAQAISAAIQDELERKGYRASDDPDADLVVGFSVDGQPRKTVQESPIYVGGSVGWENPSFTVDYVEGHLAIDVYDAAAKSLVWHGLAEVELLEPPTDPELPRSKVKAILADFPAR